MKSFRHPDIMNRPFPQEESGEPDELELALQILEQRIMILEQQLEYLMTSLKIGFKSN